MTQVSVQEHEIDLPVNHFPQPLLQQGGTIVSVPLSIEDDATVTRPACLFDCAGRIVPGEILLAAGEGKKRLVCRAPPLPGTVNQAPQPTAISTGLKLVRLCLRVVFFRGLPFRC